MERLNLAAIFRKPEPRQQWINGKFVKSTEHTEMIWVDLFIDLIYVAMIYKISEVGTICYNQPYKIFRAFVLFWNLCLTRMSIDEYSNRFYSNDLVHKLLYLVYSGGVFVQVMNLNYVATSRDGFCKNEPFFSMGVIIGIIITRISLVLTHLGIININSKARDQFKYDLIRWTISICFLIFIVASRAFREGSELFDFIILLVVAVVETFGWVISRLVFRHKFTFPIDLEVLQNRWGNLVMIVFGEGVIQMLIHEYSKHELSRAYEINILSLLLIFSLAMQYFDSCQREWYLHALSRSSHAGIAWIWFHPFLTFFLCGVGVGIKLMFGEEYTSHYIIVLSTSCFASTLMFIILRLTHSNFAVSDRLSGVVLRSLLSIFIGSVQFWNIRDPVSQLIALVMFSFCINVIDVFTFDDRYQVGDYEIRDSRSSGSSDLPIYDIAQIRGESSVRKGSQSKNNSIRNSMSFVVRSSRIAPEIMSRRNVAILELEGQSDMIDEQLTGQPDVSNDESSTPINPGSSKESLAAGDKFSLTMTMVHDPSMDRRESDLVPLDTPRGNGSDKLETSRPLLRPN